jgi:hypothetical protein
MQSQQDPPSGRMGQRAEHGLVSVQARPRNSSCWSLQFPMIFSLLAEYCQEVFSINAKSDLAGDAARRSALKRRAGITRRRGAVRHRAGQRRFVRAAAVRTRGCTLAEPFGARTPGAEPPSPPSWVAVRAFPDISPLRSKVFRRPETAGIATSILPSVLRPPVGLAGALWP